MAYRTASFFMLASLTVGSAAFAQPATGPTTRATIEETSLGTVAGFESPHTIAMDLDANHVAFIGVRDKQQYVVLDGKPSPGYDQVMAESLAFSPKGARLSYLIQTATETVPVIDGKQAKGYYAIDHNRVFWSPDGKRTAYIAQFQGGGEALVLDGVEGPHYDAVDVPIFSHDSARVAYVAKKGKHQFVVLDGKEQKEFDVVAVLSFSPNSKHIAYEGITNGKAMLVLNNQEGKAYDSVKIGPGFSATGGRLVAVVAQNGKLVVVVNGVESPPYEALLLGDFVLSPDGNHIAYAVKQGNEQRVILDNVPQQPFDHIGSNSLLFSPDSKRLAYQAGDAGKGHDFVIVDGVKGPYCDGVLTGTPFFSPDSKHIAYGALHDKKWQYMIDTTTGKAYDVIEKPAMQMFSPDSRRFAYRAFIGDRPIAVIDDAETTGLDAVGPIAFSPDSKHAAYLIVRDDKTYLSLDGVDIAGPYNPMSPKILPIYDDATTLHIIATRKDEFIRAKAKINP